MRTGFPPPEPLPLESHALLGQGGGKGGASQCSNHYKGYGSIFQERPPHLEKCRATYEERCLLKMLAQGDKKRRLPMGESPLKEHRVGMARSGQAPGLSELLVLPEPGDILLALTSV